ncbi:MAG: hypothetical protein GC168_08550 [Candidatus Hydrogenedens sp.]|nr:hypothetical protein [Candidatus Hydrogenedens sp.]
MAIPGDPLNRWWRDVALVDPFSIFKMRSALICILAFDRWRQPNLFGTGFVATKQNAHSLIITAKHVLTEGVARFQALSYESAPSALFRPPRTDQPSTDSARLKMVWICSGNGEMLNVMHISYNDTIDIACCVATPQDDCLSNFRPTSICLDTTVPSVGSVVHIISHDAMEQSEDTPPTNNSGNGHEITLRKRVSIREGVVTSVHQNGYRQYKWPCFTTSIPVDPGMSGGFVSMPHDGDTISAVGIVSADGSCPESRIDTNKCGESVIACMWPALALRVPETIPSTPTTKLYTIYEMMKSGKMSMAVGGVDHLNLIKETNDGYRIVPK